MTTATHLLIHKFRPATGPQPGTPEHDREMQQWEEVDKRLRSEGLLVDAYAITESGTVLTANGTNSLAGDREMIFAVHAVSVPDEQAGVALAKSMPTAEYGTVEIRPLMP